MELRAAFGNALRKIRLHQGLPQEHFNLVSSRTNISLLERGKTIPTLDKLEKICGALGVHPMTLMAMCYCERDGVSMDTLLESISLEMQTILNNGCQTPENID